MTATVVTGFVMGILLFASCNSAVVQHKNDFDYNSQTNSAVQQDTSANTDDENIARYHAVRDDAELGIVEDFDRDFDNVSATDRPAGKKSRSKRSVCPCCNGINRCDLSYSEWINPPFGCTKVCHYTNGEQFRYTYSGDKDIWGCMDKRWIKRHCGGYAW